MIGETPKLDAAGRVITEPELPGKVIDVWIITPGTLGYDETWIREYGLAVDTAQEILYQAVDAASTEDARSSGVSVNMKLRSMTLEEYNEVADYGLR